MDKDRDDFLDRLTAPWGLRILKVHGGTKGAAENQPFTRNDKAKACGQDKDEGSGLNFQ
jgi:hypothetical protein